MSETTTGSDRSSAAVSISIPPDFIRPEGKFSDHCARVQVTIPRCSLTQRQMVFGSLIHIPKPHKPGEGEHMGDETYTGFFIDWIEQWSQFFERCNWYTFH